LGRRSRTRKPSADLKTAAAVRQEEAARPDRYAGSRAKDEAVRQSLEPVAPGDRPTAVAVGAVVCAVLGIANVALFAGGVEVRGTKPSLVGVLAFTALMITCGYGMWRSRYWAVLGFEALLGVTLVVAGLSLAVASNVSALVLCLAILGLGGWLFWKLVRAMARIQMPERGRPGS
jgi:cation transport ATPase